MAVTEAEIVRALKRLIRAGFFVEPTSATVLAAIDALTRSRGIRRGEAVVAVLTGSGLKALDRIQALFDG